MSEISRRALYKNNDRDFETQRRSRNDHSVEMRKAKKEDQLQKRRNIEVDDLTDEETAESPVSQEVSIDEVPRLLADGSATDRLAAAASCRRQLSRLNNPPIDAFHKNGTIPLLVAALGDRASSDQLVFECAWAITNIASGDSRHTAAVVAAGAAPALLQLIGHASQQVAEQSVWALANIAGDSARLRNRLVEMGVVSVVLGALARFRDNSAALRQTCWLVSNICRHRSDSYPLDQIRALLAPIRDLLRDCADIPARVDLCWALAYATDSREELIDSVIDIGLLELLCRTLQSSRDGTPVPPELITPSLRALGNVIAGTDKQADAALRAGAVPIVGALLSHSMPRLVKESCWVLSNVSAGTEHQINVLIESGVVVPVLGVMRNGDYKSQKEAAWVISNMANSQGPGHKLYLLNNDVFSAIVPLLLCDDNKVTLLLLDAVRELFQCADNIGELDQCIAVFEAARGIDALENLQNHELVDIYNKSYDLVKDFIGGEEEDVEEQELVEGGSNAPARFAF